MKPGLRLFTRRYSQLLVAAWLACALGCADDKVDSAARGGNSGEGGSGGAGANDASIEDASDGDGAVEENGGAGGAGSGGAGAGGSGTGGESGTGDSAAGGDSGGGGSGSEPDASVDTDAGWQDAVCFAGGDEQAPSGTGACDSPIVIDMLDLEYGDTVFHRSATTATNGLVPSIGKCAEGTGRDIVYNVLVPDEADLEVSVDAADDSDPIILVQDGPDSACDKAAATLCVDDTALGECEYLRIAVSQGGYGDNTPQVVIAETEPSGVALKVRFRLIDPGGGS